MEQTKLCITLVWRNKIREIVMKYSCKRREWNRRSYVVLLYGGTEEGKQFWSLVVEEGIWNTRSYVVLLHGGTEEGKQL